METTSKSNAINLGLYLGAALSAIVVLIYAINLDLFIDWWLGILFFLLVIVFGIVSSVKARKIQNGFINFKAAFSNYFITVAVGTGITTIVSILIFSFIDTDAAVYLNEQVLLVTKQSMERFGASQEIVTQALAEASTKDNFSVVNQLVSYVFRLAFYALTGLVVALILKKSDTNQA